MTSTLGPSGFTEPHDKSVYNVLYPLTLSLWIVLTASGNILVIVGILRDSVLKQVRDNWYLISISASGLLIALLSFPSELVPSKSHFACKACVFFANTSVTANLLSQVAAAIDQCITVCYRKEPKRKSTKIAISGIWAFALLYATRWIATAGAGPLGTGADEINCIPLPEFESINQGFIYFDAIALYLIPVGIIVVCNIKTVLCVRKYNKETEERARTSTSICEIKCTIPPGLSAPEFIKTGSPSVSHQATENGHQVPILASCGRRRAICEKNTKSQRKIYCSERCPEKKANVFPCDKNSCRNKQKKCETQCSNIFVVEAIDDQQECVPESKFEETCLVAVTEDGKSNVEDAAIVSGLCESKSSREFLKEAWNDRAEVEIDFVEVGRIAKMLLILLALFVITSTPSNILSFLLIFGADIETNGPGFNFYMFSNAMRLFAWTYDWLSVVVFVYYSPEIQKSLAKLARKLFTRKAPQPRPPSSNSFIPRPI